MEVGTPRTIDANALKGRDFEYFDFVMATFVAILLLSNVPGAGKIASIDLKRKEGVDVFDRDTNFTPFRADV